jgi:hypothetical protein
VFTDFKRTIYIDRLKPEAAVVNFEPFASSPGTLQNRDLIVRSVDGTADTMYFLLDQPASLSDEQIMGMLASGNSAGYYDRDQFIRGYNGVRTGNHVATVVTFEPTGNYNIQRIPGLFTQTELGVGLGDLTSRGGLQTNDILGTGVNAFEGVLFSQNTLFNAAADVDANGLVDNRDLFGLGAALTAQGASAAVLDAYDTLLLKRGDVNQDGVTNGADVAALHGSFGATGNWLKDLNVDGTVTLADVNTLITELVRTTHGDFNLDRVVDGTDFLIWQRGLGTSGARFDQGDAGLNGVVGGDDLAVWRNTYGTTGPVITTTAAATIPEPTAATLLCLATLAMGSQFRQERKRLPMNH